MPTIVPKYAMTTASNESINRHIVATIHENTITSCLREGEFSAVALNDYSQVNANHWDDSRGGASGNKLKMTLGLPVFVTTLPRGINF